MEKFMQIAIDEAREGMEQNHGGPFGAIVVKDGKIISRAHNRVLVTNDPTAHAEVLAIRKASEVLDKFDLSDCEIYTSSQPCPMCLAAIYWARIKKVYFGTNKEDVAAIGFDDSLFYKLIRGDADKSPLEIINIDRKECLELLKEWDEKTDKEMY
jgi:guanine deaminase